MFNYVDTDSVYNVLSGQEVQKLRVESEIKLQQKEYESYTLMSVYNESENHINRTLNKLYGRENIYDS